MNQSLRTFATLNKKNKCTMITGENKNKIDQIWNVLFANGINNPILVVEQLTYLLFIKMLDDKQIEKKRG